MPKKGEHVTINKVIFKVTSADNRRIQTLQVTIPKGHEVTGKVID
jgi:magnesium and cobalt transporter